MEQVDGDVRRSDALRAAIRRSPWRVLCLGSSIPSGCFRATAMSLKGRKPPPSRLHERVICQSDQLQPNHTTGRLSAPAPTSCARNYPGSLGGLTPQGLGNGEGEPLGASAWNSSRRGFVIFQSTARPPPHGLGLATAATFLPHFEQRMPDCLERCCGSAQARQRLRFGDSSRTGGECPPLRRSRIDIVQYVGGFLRDTSGVHCYFPEWADRPVEGGTPQESDRNSYLAGGYAEEFGYSAQRGHPPAAPAPHGDPEQSRQWRVQIGGLHPGYPECPRPLDRGVIRSLDGASDRAGRVPIGIKHAGPENMDTWNKPAGQLRVVCVGQRNSPAPTRIGLLSGLILVWKDFRIRRRALGGFF